MRKINFLILLFLITTQCAVAENDSIFVISKINLSGNKITHDNIVFRELTFKIGDTITLSSYEKLKTKSSENLMNISVFNFVTITETIDNKNITVTIQLTERWYIWPIPVFDLADRNFNTWWKTKDFNRVNYGVDLAIFNFRGRNETLDLLLSLGFDEKYGFIYKIPYINKKQTLGLIISGNYIQSHEIALKDSNNKVVFYKNNESYPKKTINSSIGITYRRNIHNVHTFQFGFEKYMFNDILMQLNPEYSIDNLNETNYFTLYYQFKNDFRDYKPYPLKGHYFDMDFNKFGLGLFSDEVADFISFKTNYRKYFQISPKFYLASGITAMVNSKFPYFVQNGLGYIRDYARGYEHYVISGQGFGLIKNNLKYAILPQRVSKIHVIKTEKFNTIPYAFYVNLYADAAYVYNEKDNNYNSLVNKLLLGFGAGIDFVTYYDKVLRVEYSINRMGENGLFIHFMTSI